MEDKFKIKFKISVFSKFGSLVDKFTVEAATMEEAKSLIENQLKAEGIYKDVNYKII